VTVRFRIDDVMNTYVRELVIEAPNEDEARRCAQAWLFARRGSDHVTLTVIGADDG
jgi:hypothetical protein